MRSLLVAALVCLALFGNAHAGASFPVNDGIVKPGKADGKPYVYPKGNCGSCSAITAWDYISSTPSLSAVAGLIKAIGLDAALKGPFTGTLALPTNEAVAAYAAQFRGNVTAYPEVFNNFLTKLLTYHFILRSAPAWQLSTVALSVRYRNVWTATPHTVTFVVDPSVSKRAPGDWQWSRKNMKNRPMPRVFAVTHIVDEQGNNVTFASKDNFVLGGGVIHTINSVLNAYDIFPSVSAAAAGNPSLSSLFDVLQQVSAALNISVVDQIDSTPGTLLAPTNDALNQSLSTLPITPTPAQLYAVLQYHFCPAPGGNVKGLLYFKFKADKVNRHHQHHHHRHHRHHHHQQQQQQQSTLPPKHQTTTTTTTAAGSGAGGAPFKSPFVDPPQPPAPRNSDVNGPAARLTAAQRPKTNRSFAELLDRSLLLRYHNDRVQMFQRLRGGFTTGEGLYIPFVAERHNSRSQETMSGNMTGLGHLFFLSSEKPIPVPITEIAVFDKQVAAKTVATLLAAHKRDVTPTSVAAELKRQIDAASLSIKSECTSIHSAIFSGDFDTGMSLCQRVMMLCKQLGLLRIKAIALQIFLSINDILVIENIGSTFEEAVRKYLMTTENHQGELAHREVPDLTTVLELYTLLVGGADRNPAATTGSVSRSQISVGTALSAAASPQQQSRNNPHNATTSSSNPSANSATTGSSNQSGNGTILSSQPPIGMATANISQARFQPTLLKPYDMAGSETGIHLPLRGGVMSITSQHAGHEMHSSTASTMMSAGSSFLGPQAANGLGMPVILRDDGQHEEQRQLIEQVRAMLELQQLMLETLDYLLGVLRHHSMLLDTEVQY